MKKRVKQNKKKYDNYSHIVPWWKKMGFKSKEDGEKSMEWINETAKKYGWICGIITKKNTDI